MNREEPAAGALEPGKRKTKSNCRSRQTPRSGRPSPERTPADADAEQRNQWTSVSALTIVFFDSRTDWRNELDIRLAMNHRDKLAGPGKAFCPAQFA